MIVILVVGGKHQQWQKCRGMRSDYYKNGEHHANTGIFTEGDTLDKGEYHIVETPYLESLGMKLCQYCG